MRNKFIITFILAMILSFPVTVGATTIPVENLTREINVEINSTPIPYVDYYVSKTNGFKSYMSYRAITKVDSPQYLLQEICGTDADGFRKCADRYVIAVGSGVGGQVGDCVDLILKNGQVIYCVIGDYKSNKYTDAANLTGFNGCCSEFIVDPTTLRRDIKYRGNIGCGYVGWDSPVLVIRRYSINYLLYDFGGKNEKQHS